MGLDYIKLNRNLKCKNCGSISQRNGKCWEEDLCAKCYKNQYLKCEECGKSGSHRDRICWSNGLCGSCHRRKTRPKMFKQYHICTCGTRMNCLHFWKNGKIFNTNNMICTKCSIIYVGRNKYKLASIIT